MDGYQQRTEKKKKAIIQASFELFSTYGVDKVSLAEIAKNARVSPVTIYNYFGTKDELVRKVLFSFLEEEWARQIELMRSDLSFPQKIRKMMFGAILWTDKLNSSFIQQLLSDDPEWKELVEKIYTEAVPELIQFIEHGKAQGYIDKDISSDTIFLYFNLIKEMKLTNLFKQSLQNPQTIDELTHLFFYGILNRQVDKSSESELD